MHRLSFITLNVRGINSSRKRRATFRPLHNKNASGYNPEDKRALIFNYFILLGKRHIFTQRFEQKTPKIDLFFDFVKGKLIVHKCIFQSKGLINKFHSLWKSLLCSL